LIELLVALDLSDKGVRAGPMYYGRFQLSSNIHQIQDYKDWFGKQERLFEEHEPGGEWFGQLRKIIDFATLSGARSPQSWLCGGIAIGSEMAQAWGVPGFSLITLDDLRLRRDTPQDRLENLNVNAILPQLAGVRELLRKAWNDPKF